MACDIRDWTSSSAISGAVLAGSAAVVSNTTEWVIVLSYDKESANAAKDSMQRNARTHTMAGMNLPIFMKRA